MWCRVYDERRKGEMMLYYPYQQKGTNGYII